ncbi:MAG: hypothetical protein ACTHK5_08315 [Tsuneonella sp.]
MGLLRIATLGALGYAGYQYYQKNFGHQGRAAFAGNQGHHHGHQVRDSGPEAMRDKPRREWDKVDEISDESFPASDPPATY